MDDRSREISSSFQLSPSGRPVVQSSSIQRQAVSPPADLLRVPLVQNHPFESFLSPTISKLIFRPFGKPHRPTVSRQNTKQPPFRKSNEKPKPTLSSYLSIAMVPGSHSAQLAMLLLMKPL